MIRPIDAGSLVQSKGISACPKVVVVILNWNAWPHTIECAESVMRSGRPPQQIVICDNGSSDGSLDRLTEWADGLLEIEAGGSREPLRWKYRPAQKPIPYNFLTASELSREIAPAPETSLVFISIASNFGYAGGNNVGIQYALDRAEADFVWVLNNDAVVDRQALAELVNAASTDPSIGIVGCEVLAYKAPDRIQARGGGAFVPSWGYDSQLGRGQRFETSKIVPVYLDHLIGVSLLVRAQAIRDVGLMDERYFIYREDTDWCIRMRLKQWRLIACTSAVVWHKEGTSLGFKSPAHDYYSVRNQLWLLKKFYPSSLPSAFILFALRSIVPKIARLQFRRLLHVILAYRDFLRGIQGRAHDDEALMAARKAQLK